MIRYLHALANKGGIIIARDRKTQPSPEPKPKCHTFFAMVAEFSCIGLAHVMNLLSDYTTSLQALDSVDLNQGPHTYFSGVLAANATLHYHLGFSYTMLRRYGDAINTYSAFLNHMSRNKHAMPQSYQEENINSLNDKITALLGLVTNLCPQNIDPRLQAQVMHQLSHDDKYNRMQRGEISAFESVFMESAPKFIFTHLPDFEALGEVQMEARQQQLRIFSDEIQSKQKLADLHSYLKMVSIINVDKLQTFFSEDDEILKQAGNTGTAGSEALIHALLANKIQGMGLKRVNVESLPIDGEWRSNVGIHFFVDKDVIHVTESQEVDRHAAHLQEAIMEYEDINFEIRRLGKIAAREE